MSFASLLAALTPKESPAPTHEYFNQPRPSIQEWVPPEYRQLIMQAGQQYNVPAHYLAALIRQESNFNPNARSPAGAQGIAQFMPGTARQYGINALDPNQAIPAAAKFLQSNYQRAGNWQDAIAGYNAGPGRMSGNWNQIPETRDYVRRVEEYSGEPLSRRDTPSNPSVLYQQEPMLDPTLLQLLLASL